MLKLKILLAFRDVFFCKFQAQESFRLKIVSGIESVAL